VKPSILVAATSRWFAPVRLSLALREAGFTVYAVCPPRHPVLKTSALAEFYKYHGLAPLASFERAIAACNPDLILPCDDLSTLHLHQIYERRKTSDAQLTQLIERSLGSPEGFPVLFARTAFMKLAEREGVRVPKTSVITDSSDLKSWIAETGLPTVLKADGSSGGEGVRTVSTFEQAQKTHRDLGSPPLMARAAKRTIVDQDSTLVWPSILRTHRTVNAQAFVRGKEATTLVVCWKGTVLAGLHFEVVVKRDSTGPATVLRLSDNAEMAATAEKMVRRLKLSGLHGFDFMLENETQNAYLIEINPRATQIGHLRLGPGRDLPAALISALTGETIREQAALTKRDTFALFPQEWIRDPQSPYLTSAYQDVPWQEPELLLACAKKRSRPGSRQAEANASEQALPVARATRP